MPTLTTSFSNPFKMVTVFEQESIREYTVFTSSDRHALLSGGIESELYLSNLDGCLHGIVIQSLRSICDPFPFAEL